jgi:hypothetical protein
MGLLSTSVKKIFFATSALHLGPTGQFRCQSAGKCESVHIASNLGKSRSFLRFKRKVVVFRNFN